MKLEEEQILEIIKNHISQSDPCIDLSSITIYTDLITLGIDSLSIMSLMAELDSKYKIKVTLEQMEKANFKITPLLFIDAANQEI